MESPEVDAKSSRFHLAIFDDNLRSMPLVEGTLLVGRSKTAHLQLHDHLLSRKHCSLTLNEPGLTLADLNSSNGTYVNGDRVGTRQLENDDIIELGKTVLVVFDGDTWRRGEGLLNLRNPLKAQELVQILSEGGDGLKRVPAVRGTAEKGVRPHKGLSDNEHAYFRWLERGENRLLPELVADYLTHKLVSLLVRNSTSVRSAFTTVLEEMMRPEFTGRFGEVHELRAAVAEMVARELEDLRRDEAPPGDDRGLLEHVDGESEPEGEPERAEEGG